MKRTNSHQPKGFTLVELLVVIGIIAVLISILLPSLAKAREAANTLKCLSNMRQIGMAMQQYVNDSKGILPPMQVDSHGGGTFWPEGTNWTLLLSYGGYMSTTNMLNNPADRYSHNFSSGNVWMCPSMANDVYIGGNATTHWDGQQNMSTYNFSALENGGPNYFGIATSYGLLTVGNQYAMQDTFPFVRFWYNSPATKIDTDLRTVSWRRNISQVRKTTTTPLIVEGQSMNYWQKAAGLCPYPDLLAAHHGQPTNKGWDGKSNVVFFDGHGETLDTNLISSCQLPTYGQYDFSSIQSSMTLLMRDQTK